MQTFQLPRPLRVHPFNLEGELIRCDFQPEGLVLFVEMITTRTLLYQLPRLLRVHPFGLEGELNEVCVIPIGIKTRWGFRLAT